MVYFSGGKDRKEKFAASSFKDFLNMDETLHEIAKKKKSIREIQGGTQIINPGVDGMDLDYKIPL